MKKIIIPLVLVIAVLAIAPFFIGSQAETKIRELTEKANQNPTFSIEIKEYNRGWFSSEAKMQLKFSSPAMQQQADFDLIFTQSMQHGPILWTTSGLGFGLADINYGVELSEEMKAEMEKIEGLNSDSITVVSRMAFDGSSDSIFTIKPFTISKDGMNVEIKEGSFTSSIKMAGQMTVHGSWNGMQILEKDTAVLSMGVLTIDADQNLVSGEMFSPSALFSGDMNLALEKMDIAGASPAETVVVQGLSMSASSSFENNLANMNIIFSAIKVSAVGQEFDDIGYDVSFENIDQEAISTMNRAFVDNGSADPMLMIGKLQELIPQMVDKNPLIKINRLGMKTVNGEIKTSAVIGINKEIYDEKNPMSLMMALEVSATGFAPEAFFAGFGMAAEIDMLTQQNFLVRDNGQLKFDASFKGGQAILNGAVIPLGL